jgi:hypothetical protein
MLDPTKKICKTLMKNVDEKVFHSNLTSPGLAFLFQPKQLNLHKTV